MKAFHLGMVGLVVLGAAQALPIPDKCKVKYEQLVQKVEDFWQRSPGEPNANRPLNPHYARDLMFGESGGRGKTRTVRLGNKEVTLKTQYGSDGWPELNLDGEVFSIGMGVNFGASGLFADRVLAKRDLTDTKYVEAEAQGQPIGFHVTTENGKELMEVRLYSNVNEKFPTMGADPVAFAKSKKMTPKETEHFVETMRAANVVVEFYYPDKNRSVFQGLRY